MSVLAMKSTLEVQQFAHSLQFINSLSASKSNLNSADHKNLQSACYRGVDGTEQSNRNQNSEGWQTKFNVQPRSRFLSFDLRPAGPNLEQTLDQTRDLGLSLTKNLKL